MIAFILSHLKVLGGESELALGAIVNLIAFHFYMSPPFWQHAAVYFSRQPQPIVSYGNILLPFDTLVWSLAVGALFVFGTFFTCAYFVLNSPGIRYLGLVKKEHFPSNFFLFPVAKFTEPGRLNLFQSFSMFRNMTWPSTDPLPWFKKWTAGKFGTLIWMLFSILMLSFYTYNLRAHMVTIAYERPMRTLQDIAEIAEKVYIYNGAYKQRSGHNKVNFA